MIPPLIRQSFLAFLLLLIPHTTWALSVVTGPTTTVSESTATIVWKTDVLCGTRLSYGLSSKELKQRIEGEVSADHSVQVTGLQAGTTYYFSIGSARVQLGTGIFTTTGKPSTATKTAVTPTPTPPPSPPIALAVAPLPKPPATRQIWGSIESLQDHFNRHGADFNAHSSDDYAAQAWLFLQRAKRDSLPMKWDDTDRTLRVWEPKTRSFAAYDRYGRARTYFKPSNPDYWNRQPGRLLRPAELHF